MNYHTFLRYTNFMEILVSVVVDTYKTQFSTSITIPTKILDAELTELITSYLDEQCTISYNFDIAKGILNLEPVDIVGLDEFPEKIPENSFQTNDLAFVYRDATDSGILH